jgi:site-specific recombinase XerD
MALEQAFECPTTLAKLRSGPLGELLEGYCDWLLEQGFSRWSVRTHLSNLSHLNEHLGSRRRPRPQTVTAEDLDGFFRAYPARCRHRGPREEHVRRVRWSVNRFIQYLKRQGRFVDPVPPPIYVPLRDAYLDWMRRYQHAAPGTLELRAQSVTQFLQWLGPQATPDGLAGLDCERVEQFFLAATQEKGRSARRSMQSALRTFFRFCWHEGYLRQPLDRAVPTLRTYKLASVPRGLTDEQAQQVLRHIHRDTAVGRRDYAILQLLYTYGVRGGQVRSLRLEEIDWAQDQILFRAAKHGKDIRLPLTPEVGESLLDYLRNARPACSCPEVFLTCRAPSHRLPNSNSLSALVERRIRAAGIDLASNGAHAFRHGFATRMLQQGHSLKAIADVLGHRHLGTTFLYTKVDFNALTQVALPWPEEVSE